MGAVFSKFKKPKGKKVFKKKYFKKKNPNMTMNRSMVVFGSGFPKKLEFTHTYDLAFQTIASAVGGLASVQFSTNGMFRPAAASANSVFYYDQLIALYDHWTVIGSKCQITVVPNLVTTAPFVIGLYVNDDTSTTATNYNEMLEYGNSSKSGTHKFISLGNADAHTITSKWSAKKTFGGSILGNDDLQGSAILNPVEQSFYQFYMQSMDGISSTAAIYNVKITYIAIWDELRDIRGSV